MIIFLLACCVCSVVVQIASFLELRRIRCSKVNHTHDGTARTTQDYTPSPWLQDQWEKMEERQLWGEKGEDSIPRDRIPDGWDDMTVSEKERWILSYRKEKRDEKL